MASTKNIFPLFLTSRGPTVKAMQEILQRIGEATGGTKDVVQTRLLTRVTRPTLRSSQRGTRILSIDMGIRNLAYCVAEVQGSTPRVGAAKMDILAWRRMDLSEAYRKHWPDENKKRLGGEAVLEGREEDDPYTPESLSSMAYWLFSNHFLDWRPDIILIERQRWRSAGSPTIQQWTVRVNTLEAIIWAMLTTLKSRDLKIDWQVYAVDPKRVGHFWLDEKALVPTTKSKKADSKITASAEENDEDDNQANSHLTENAKKLSRGKAEKKAKIQLLRTWLDSDNPSTALYSKTDNINTEDSPVRYPNISFSFSKHSRGTTKTRDSGSDATRQALLYATDKPSERVKRTEYLKDYVKKVDDITDCFLQAAAFVAWEENLRILRPQVDEFWKEVRDRGGKEMNMKHGNIAEVVRELQGGGKKIWEESKGGG